MPLFWYEKSSVLGKVDEALNTSRLLQQEETYEKGLEMVLMWTDVPFQQGCWKKVTFWLVNGGSGENQDTCEIGHLRSMGAFVSS